MEKQKKFAQRGITLVALVITIILLLILAGISISSLTNSGLFENAKLAEERTKNAQEKEQSILSQYEQIMNGYLLKDTENTKPVSAMPAGSTVIEKDARKGIVIADKNGNEWTWVEVPKTTVFKTAQNATDYANIKTDLINYATTYREGKAGQGASWSDEWYEGCGIVAEGEKTAEQVYTEKYNKMLSSVYTNGGFWISRYEIGDATATANNATRVDGQGKTGKAVSKAGQIPYNWVTCSQAQELASGMTPDETKYTSSLLFGIQWDLVCKYLEVNVNWDTTSRTAISYLNSDSSSWGNYSSNANIILSRGKYNPTLDVSGTWTQYTNTAISKNLITTGAYENANKMNIYDFAGNALEWTLEKTTDSSKRCAYRGGCYDNAGSYGPASRRYGNSTDIDSFIISFRSTFY